MVDVGLRLVSDGEVPSKTARSIFAFSALTWATRAAASASSEAMALSSESARARDGWGVGWCGRWWSVGGFPAVVACVLLCVWGKGREGHGKGM